MKPRLLTPSEIELWELAEKRERDFPPTIYIPTVTVRTETLKALLETLEETRACLAEAERVMVTVDPNKSDNWNVYVKVIDRTRALLAAFKEAK